MGLPPSGGVRAAVCCAGMMVGLLASGCEALPFGGAGATPAATAGPTSTPVVATQPARAEPVRPTATVKVAAETPVSAMPTPGAAAPQPQARRFGIVLPPTATASPTRTATPERTATSVVTPTAQATVAAVPFAPTAATPSATPTPTWTLGAPTPTLAASAPGATPLAAGTPVPGATPTATATRRPLLTPLATRTPLPSPTIPPTVVPSPTPSPTPAGPLVQSSSATPYQFINDINAAIDMLRTRSNEDYTIVFNRLRTITEEVPPRAEQHVFRVQVSTKQVWLSRGKMREWGDTDLVRWTASVLAHAAWHVDLFERLIDYDTCEAELQTMERQRKALEQMTAPAVILLYLDGLIAEKICTAEPAGHVVP